MHGWFEMSRKFVAGLTRRETGGQLHSGRSTGRRYLGGDADWLPPVMGPADWSNSYFIAMANHDADWYFERRER